MAAELELADLAQLLLPEADPLVQIEAVAACLGKPQEQVRQVAAVVLGRIGEPAAGHLTAALDPGQPDSVRIAAALGIAAIGAPASAAVRPLCRCLTSPCGELRSVASVALAKIGPAAVPALRIVLQFSDLAVVGAAVSALSYIGPAAAESLADIQNLSVRWPLPLKLAGASAAVRVGGDPASSMPLLLQALQDPDPEVRKTGLERISELLEAAHPVVPAIIRCLADSVPAVRAAAALTLGRIKAPADQALPALVRVLEDDEAEVRLKAVIALSGFKSSGLSSIPELRRLLIDSDTSVATAAAAVIRE
jgi:HEAT repeat protein